MKRILIFLLLYFTVNFLYSAEVSRTLPVGGSIGGISDFGIKVKTIANNTEVASLSWADQIAGSGWQMADSYIELTVNCNYVWQIDIYTNNTTAETGYQKGGLLSTSTTTVRVPLAWVISDSTITVANVGEPGELTKNIVAGSTTTINAMWTYLKDKNDLDDPNTSAWAEDWTTANQSGYTTVAYGNATYANLSYGLAFVSPLVVYLQGEFYYVMGNMQYQSDIYFDMVFK